MKTSGLLGERFKEKPAECTLDSHALMIRGGYIKNMGSGIFSLYMPAKRSVRKIENIIRDEMDRIGGQEVMFPVVMPASIWRESGRYDSIGSEMVRFKDRGESDMVLGMTHEEAAVHMARDVAQTYAKYPFMIYQIQTKFRDEPRARGGLIRVREFTMKDAYSFHTSEEDLKEYYAVCYDAYNRIFARAGIRDEVVSVQSDSGMMGGSVSHEFMLLTDVGEDTLAICKECDFSANVEVAECIVENDTNEEKESLELVNTPDTKTIEDVSKFLNKSMEKIMKAVVYQENLTDDYIIAFVRGDLDVNEIKLRNKIGCEVHPATSYDSTDIEFGYIGLYGLNKNVKYVVDNSLKGACNLVCGANKEGYHYTGFNIERDFGEVEYADIATTFDGATCPKCGKKAIKFSRGIEVGNIFQLGQKYTKSMGMTYINSDGEEKYPIMGCYGIGVGRMLASICEVKHDDNGPIWPITVAPWEVQLCALRVDDEEVRKVADKMYDELQKAGLEVIYDDREISAGVMFADADLLGVPVRVTVSPRNLKNGELEISTRDKEVKEFVKIDNAVDMIKNLVAKKYEEIEMTVCK